MTAEDIQGTLAKGETRTYTEMSKGHEIDLNHGDVAEIVAALNKPIGFALAVTESVEATADKVSSFRCALTANSSSIFRPSQSRAAPRGPDGS